MNLQEQLTLVEKAVANDELKELFLGAPGYEWGNLKHIPANVATDIGAIIKYGLYVLYQNGNMDIQEKLKRTVFDLLNGTPTEIWTAYSIIWQENWYKNHGEAVFCIYNNELKNDLSVSINKNKSSLMSCHALVGQGLKDGLWEDINRLENNLRKKYGEGLI